MVTTIKNTQPSNLILRCMASFDGLITLNVEGALNGLQAPLNTTMGRTTVKNKPVDVARNDLVKLALHNNARYMLFIDDDVLPPWDGLNRLWYQLENSDEKVATGVYYSKTQPSMPVILKADSPGGYTKWDMGEVIDVDYAGCGFMLIKMDLFDEWPADTPYFKFNRGRVDLTPGVGFLGEDVWFCKIVTDLGYKIIVDTAVQCGHEDNAAGLIYKYDKRFSTGVWVKDGTNQVLYLPTLKQADERREEAAPKIGGKVSWSNAEIDGYQSIKTAAPGEIRLTLDGVTSAIIKDLFQYQANEQSHGIVKAVYDVMADGGTVEIHVPNAVERCKLKDDSPIEDIEKMTGMTKAKFLGLYNKRFMSDTMLSAGFKDISIEKGDDAMLIVKGTK